MAYLGKVKISIDRWGHYTHKSKLRETDYDVHYEFKVILKFSKLRISKNVSKDLTIPRL